MSKTIARHIRIDADHWRRIEALANEHRTTPNQLLVELAVEALEHREWPQNPLEIQMHRSCLFTAQATARDMISTGRRDEVEAVRREISKIDITRERFVATVRARASQTRGTITLGTASNHVDVFLRTYVGGQYSESSPEESLGSPF